MSKDTINESKSQQSRYSEYKQRLLLPMSKDTINESKSQQAGSQTLSQRAVAYEQRYNK